MGRLGCMGKNIGMLCRNVDHMVHKTKKVDRDDKVVRDEIMILEFFNSSLKYTIEIHVKYASIYICILYKQIRSLKPAPTMRCAT